LIQELLSGPNSEQDQAGVVSEPRPHPLFRAAVISGSDQLVQMHIARGRDVNSRDESGTSLLGLAASKGNLGTFKLLLEAGANPAVKDLQGRDPLEIARANGHVTIVELLSELNAVERPAASILETVPESDAAVESDGEFWVAEASPNEPAGDPEYVSRAAANETRITDFEYLSPDEDWDDVYADLPTYQAFAGIRKQEFHVLRSELIRFFGSAIVSGTVLNDQIAALGDDGDEFDEEARECIGRMLDELGIEVLEGIDPEIIPEAGAAGRVHLGINSDSHLKFGKTAFYQFQKKWRGHGDPAHAQFLQLAQQGRHFSLPGAGPFAIGKTGTVQEIVKGNAVTIEQPDVIPQISFRQRCRQVAGTTTADTIGGKFSVNFINRIASKLRNQFRVVIRSQRKLGRAGCDPNGALIGAGCFHEILESSMLNGELVVSSSPNAFATADDVQEALRVVSSFCLPICSGTGGVSFHNISDVLVRTLQRIVIHRL
jgi:hypothetical protein